MSLPESKAIPSGRMPHAIPRIRTGRHSLTRWPLASPGLAEQREDDPEFRNNRGASAAGSKSHPHEMREAAMGRLMESVAVNHLLPICAHRPKRHLFNVKSLYCVSLWGALQGACRSKRILRFRHRLSRRLFFE